MKFKVKCQSRRDEDEWTFEDVERSGEDNFEHVMSSHRSVFADLIMKNERSAALETLDKLQRFIGSFKMGFSEEQNALFDALFDMMRIELNAENTERLAELMRWTYEPWSD